MPGSNPLRLCAFGRPLELVATGNGWKAYYPGADGKRRRAYDIVVPPGITEQEVARYVADICHEWASETHPDVIIVESST